MKTESVWTAFVLGWLALVCACSSHRAPEEVGGDTHWLAACDKDSDCGSYSCVCGACTKPCSRDASCSVAATKAIESICVDTESPALVQRCEPGARAHATSVCVAECKTHAGCRDGQSCVSGACLPAGDSSAGSLSSTIEKPVRLSDFAELDAAVSWDEPVSEPPPEIAIEGGDDRLVGTWIDVGPNGNCGPKAGICMQVEIRRASDRTYTGKVSFVDTTGKARLHGPFPPASDPDVGYPPGVDINDYGALRNPWEPVPGIAYRMFDGQLAGNRFSFWFTPRDLWRDWCALQVSYPWEHANLTSYACVPKDPEAQAAIDRGKLELCAACGPSQVACLEVYCRCDAHGCEAELGTAQTRVSVAFDGDKLTGALLFDANAKAPVEIELHKVTP